MADKETSGVERRGEERREEERREKKGRGEVGGEVAPLQMGAGTDGEARSRSLRVPPSKACMFADLLSPR